MRWTALENADGHKWANSRWNVAVPSEGSGEGLLPGRLRPGMAEREATGTYSRRSWKQALPRARGTMPEHTVRAGPARACRPGTSVQTRHERAGPTRACRPDTSVQAQHKSPAGPEPHGRRQWQGKQRSLAAGK